MSDPLKFEEALSELEAVIKKMESGELSLDDSLQAFERGVELARQCRKKLEEAERKVEILLRDESGKLTTEPLESTPPESE